MSSDRAYISEGMVKGPTIGTYADKPIPAWIRTHEGYADYVGVTGPVVDLDKLKPGQFVIAPGLLYQGRKGGPE